MIHLQNNFGFYILGLMAKIKTGFTRIKRDNYNKMGFIVQEELTGIGNWD
jgi:hypothetical protein